MAAIRAKTTKPDIVVRKYLWRHGYRYIGKAQIATDKNKNL